MEFKIEKTLNYENNIEILRYKSVCVYKHLVDFTSTFLNSKYQYEIAGLKIPLKVNDLIYLDLSIWEDCHSYIRGKVIKVCKNKIIIDFDYVDLI